MTRTGPGRQRGQAAQDQPQLTLRQHDARMTAVSPCCTGEGVDHPRSISHLPAKQPATPWPFAKRNSSAAEAFFRMKKRHWGMHVLMRNDRTALTLACPACSRATPHRFLYIKNGCYIFQCRDCGLGR